MRGFCDTPIKVCLEALNANAHEQELTGGNCGLGHTGWVGRADVQVCSAYSVGKKITINYLSNGDCMTLREERANALFERFLIKYLDAFRHQDSVRGMTDSNESRAQLAKDHPELARGIERWSTDELEKVIGALPTAVAVAEVVMVAAENQMVSVASILEELGLLDKTVGDEPVQDS